MNKHIGFILSVIFGIVCFSAGTYYSWMNLETRIQKYAERFEEIDDKVAAFVKVSDPKTIRSYVKQLYEIIDNMTRLGKLIEGGEELDVAIGQYTKEYKKLHTKVVELLSEVEQQGKDTQSELEYLQGTTNSNFSKITSLESVIKSQEQKLITLLAKKEMMDSDLQEVQSILKTLKNSKLSKYFER